MDLLDEVVMHSNVTSLLYLRIRDPELDCHECVASGLRQHSRRQLRKVSPSNSFSKISPVWQFSKIFLMWQFSKISPGNTIFQKISPPPAGGAWGRFCTSAIASILYSVRYIFIYFDTPFNVDDLIE
jgi:hypothetical protein